MNSALISQESITSADFFARPLPPPTNLASTSGPPPSMPWIERYELRTETRDLVPDRQEYTLRLTPSTPRLRRAQANYAAALERAPDVLNSEYACEANERRHRDWLALYTIDRELLLLDSLTTVLADRQTILDRKAGTLDFDWAELVDARKDQTNLAARRTQLRYERRQILSRQQLPDRQLDFADFPSINDFQVATGAALEPADLPETQYELGLIEREIELERAERRRYFDFAQFRYRGPHDIEFSDRISVGLGLRLDTRGADRIKLRELEIERELLDEELHRDRDELASARKAFASYYEQTLVYHRATQDLYRAERAEFDRLQQVLLRQETPDIELLLSLQSRSLRNQIDLLRIETGLADDYLDYLEATDQFCQAMEGEFLRVGR